VEQKQLVTALNSEDLKAREDMQHISNYNNIDQGKTLGTSGDATLRSQLTALQSRVVSSGSEKIFQNKDT
jgi:hypothetical protein